MDPLYYIMQRIIFIVICHFTFWNMIIRIVWYIFVWYMSFFFFFAFCHDIVPATRVTRYWVLYFICCVVSGGDLRLRDAMEAVGILIVFRPSHVDGYKNSETISLSSKRWSTHEVDLWYTIQQLADIYGQLKNLSVYTSNRCAKKWKRAGWSLFFYRVGGHVSLIVMNSIIIFTFCLVGGVIKMLDMKNIIFNHNE